MKTKFKWLQKSAIKKIINALTVSNICTFKFVGGCVRDSILGDIPNDFDIASSFTPSQNIELLKKHNIKVISLAINYGTIVAIIDNYQFEITTLRKDTKTYGRKAEIKFTDNYKEDALRRDFTINALYLDPITLEITDYFDGISDLRKGNIKFIGKSQERITEDYLRILRFVRFYTYYGKIKISLEQENILKQNSNKLHLLSKERISAELKKIIIHNNATKGIKLLNKLKISDLLFKQNNLNYVSLSKLKALAKHNNIDIPYVFNLLALINNQEIILTLNLNKAERKLIQSQDHLKKILQKQPKISYLLARFNKTILQYVALLILSKSNKTNKNYFYFKNLLLVLKKQENFKIPITGKDLIAMGCKESKNLGSLLIHLKQWGIEYNIHNREAYLKKAHHLINK